MIRKKPHFLIMSLLFLILAFNSTHVNAVSRGKGKSVVRVLYLGNDFIPGPDPGTWIDCNHYIIDALGNSTSTQFYVDFIFPGEDGYIYETLMIDDYDVVILSEVWRSHFSEGQINELVDFVEGGGGFIMFGGYGGFGGDEEHGGWGGTLIEEILPVGIGEDNEDAVDEKIFLIPEKHQRDHPTLHGVNLRKAPALYGFNDVSVKEDGLVVAVISEGDAPMLVVGTYGRGRVLTFMSNPAGGWGEDFVEWGMYNRFIVNMATWTANIPPRK